MSRSVRQLISRNSSAARLRMYNKSTSGARRSLPASSVIARSRYRSSIAVGAGRLRKKRISRRSRGFAWMAATDSLSSLPWQWRIAHAIACPGSREWTFASDPRGNGQAEESSYNGRLHGEMIDDDDSVILRKWRFGGQFYLANSIERNLVTICEILKG